jgi:hypothetical protein
MTKITEKEWNVDGDDRPGMAWNRHIVLAENADMRICFMAHGSGVSDDEFAEAALLIAGAPALLRAALLLEAAEEVHANCPECDGEGVPELCPACFPLFDDARIARRAALEKAANGAVIG